MYVKSWNKNGLWVDVNLTTEEEEQAFSTASDEHIDLIHKCIEKARDILNVEFPDEQDTVTKSKNVIALALTLFDKEAKHTQYYREERGRYKFEGLE